jgi:hypothetical protein
MSSKAINLARSARWFTGLSQSRFCGLLGISSAVQARRELDASQVPEVGERLYRIVIAVCALGRVELLEVLDQDERPEARSYFRLAEELRARGLEALIPRTE